MQDAKTPRLASGVVHQALQVFLRPVHRLQAVGGVDFLEDVVDVSLDGVRAQVEAAGDFQFWRR